VWRALRNVPGGAAVTYTELAALAGRPAAVRAAASGCATNLVALVVPCHRIVRTDGGLGGYLFGTDVKESLLRHEGAIR
jgi:methylated-DNA-[protein]-cysteine S-methyltransferase